MIKIVLNQVLHWIEKCVTLTTGHFAHYLKIYEELFMTEGAEKAPRNMNKFTNEKVIVFTPAMENYAPRTGSKREEMSALLSDGMTVEGYKAAAGKDAMSFLVYFANDAKIVEVK